MSAFVHPRRRSVLALTAGAGLAAVLGLAGCSGSTDETLDAKAFATAVASPGVTVVDVRTPEEFAAGHLRGAVNIDVNGPDFKAAVGELSKDGEYALYCRSGNRSATALATMKDLGFTHAYHLGGGIGAWTAAGGEVVTD